MDKRNQKIGEREKQILEVVSNFGTVAFTVLLDQLSNFLHIRNQSQYDWKVQRSLNSLENKGLVKKNKAGSVVEYQITDFGKQI